MLFKLIYFRNIILKFLYKNIIKPVLFKIDAEKVHDTTIKLGVLLGKYKILKPFIKFIFYYENTHFLSQKIKEYTFKNPIGIAAGFDKNADLINILPSIGFGFMEIGSITAKPCPGNPKPRLWRIPKLKSIAVYYGLKNDGCKKIYQKIKNIKTEIPLGISLAKTNIPNVVSLEEGIADYEETFLTFHEIGSYDVINISCPNTYGGEPFTKPENFNKLIIKINKNRNKNKMLFVKLSPDLNFDDLTKILEISKDYKIDGFICSNLTKNRETKKIKKNLKYIPSFGGLSGKLQEKLSNKQIKFIYKHYRDQFIIIGCGGIFSAQDAYKKIRLGASLIQIITGFIYEGPQLVSEIKMGLVELMQKDGFKNIKEVIGIDVK